jgi:hypothetical protein
VGEWIGLSRKIYVDGTFSLAPTIFYQILVILAERGNFVLPVCYALLPSKTEEIYRRMIRLILEAWPAMNPQAISTDFERSLINAFVAAFPDAEVHGCFFHLVQNMKKKLGELNLIRQYRRDENFNLAARMITGLAFVPPSAIDRVIADLAAFLPEDLKPALKYFEDTYVGSLLHVLPEGSIVRRRPLFAVETWSVYSRTLEDDSRTNNFAEAAHKRLQTEFGVHHPTLWRLIDGLRKIQHHRDMRYARFIGGHSSEKKRRKYVETDARLRQVVSSFHDRTSVEYLQGVARNYVMDP